MGQRNIYFPDAVENEIEQRAKNAKKSVSAYVVELIQKELKPKKFDKEFWSLAGSLSADFECPNDQDKKHDAKRESFE